MPNPILHKPACTLSCHKKWQNKIKVTLPSVASKASLFSKKLFCLYTERVDPASHLQVIRNQLLTVKAEQTKAGGPASPKPKEIDGKDGWMCFSFGPILKPFLNAYVAYSNIIFVSYSLVLCGEM